MANLLPPVGTCSYNGVTFSSRMETKDVSIRPIYDSANRTVVYNIYSITIVDRLDVGSLNQGLPKGDLSAATSTDTTLQTLRQALTAPACEFHYSDKGMGDLDVNVQGTEGSPFSGSNVKDVIWGPKPRLLRWRPIGGNQAVEITWTVEVAIPECSPNAKYALAPMEYCFRMAYNIDASGYTQRTYTGFIRIPQTRATPSTRTLADTADNYRQQIVLPCPPGFRRTASNFTLSEDKCRLDFTFTDVQLPPNYAPAGVIEVMASHSLQGTPYTSVWQGSIAATYEVALDVPRSAAWKHFLTLLQDRLGRAKNFNVPTGTKRGASGIAGAAINAVIAGIGAVGLAGAGPGEPGWAIVDNLHLEEPIYDKKCAICRASFRIAATAQNVIGASGMWAPAPESAYAPWAASMQSVLFDGRGTAKLYFKASDDAILDLCASNPQKPSPAAKTNTVRSGSSPPLANPIPPADTSWLWYEAHVQLRTVPNVVQHIPLPLAPPEPTLSGTIARAPGGGSLSSGSSFGLSNQSAGSGVSANTIPSAAADAAAPTVGSNAPTIQVRNRASYYVVLWGGASRAGWPIPMPQLLSYGGQACVPCDAALAGVGANFYDTAVVANWYGVDVYESFWVQCYVLAGPPKGALSVMSNPLAGV